MPVASPPRAAAGKGDSGRKAMRSEAQHPCQSEHGGILPHDRIEGEAQNQKSQPTGLTIYCLSSLRPDLRTASVGHDPFKESL